jgi:hypothetical protein
MWFEAQESTPKPLSKDGVTAPPATAWQFKLRWKEMLPWMRREEDVSDHEPENSRQESHEGDDEERRPRRGRNTRAGQLRRLP